MCQYSNMWTNFCHNECKFYDKKRKKCTHDEMYITKNTIMGYISSNSGIRTFNTPTRTYLNSVVKFILEILGIKSTVDDDQYMYKITVERIKKENDNV